MKQIRELVSLSNSYMDEAGDLTNTFLLENIARYLSFLLRVFGVIHYEMSIGYPIKGKEESNVVRFTVNLVCLILPNVE